jgi:RNA polymerase sigma factor (sigma-70 family)
MPSPSTVLLRTQSDERLVALARAGHDRAFEAIVERYRRQLLRACRRILPEARAEDALQQALMAAWAGLRRGDDVHELRPWLFRVVRNTALNQLRVGGYDLDELVETLGSAEDPEDEVVRRAVVRQTLAAVAALPDRQREALLRTAIEGQAQAEVARDLGLTSTAMRQLVHRARVAVRAAATAVVPMPVAAWLASAGGATLAKAGTVAVLAGAGAATAPALIEQRAAPHRTDVRAESTREAPRPAKISTPTPAAVATTAPVAAPRPVATSAPVVRSIAVERDDDEVERVETRRDDGDGHHGAEMDPGDARDDGGGERSRGPGGGEESSGHDEHGSDSHDGEISGGGETSGGADSGDESRDGETSGGDDSGGEASGGDDASHDSHEGEDHGDD